MNATRAALRAGYSKNTALNGQLMQIPKIALYIKSRREETSRKLQIDHQMVLAELAKTAFANIGDYFGADGKLKPMYEIADDKKVAIWNLRINEDQNGTTVHIRLNNKLTALEKIAKHIKFYQLEEVQPEQVYVYLDKEDLNDDDRFEDETIDALDKEEQERKAKLKKLETELYLKERELKLKEEHLKGLGVVAGGNPEPVNRELGEPIRERKLAWADTFAIVDGIACRNEAEVREVLRKQEERLNPPPVPVNAQAGKPNNQPFYGKKLSDEVRKERRQQYLDSLPPRPGQKVYF